MIGFEEIFKEWQKRFPLLSKYTDRTLFFILKPYMAGLRLSKPRFGTDEYRVYLEIIPLWENDNKSFGIPLCYPVLKIKQGKCLCPDIKFKLHDSLFHEAVESAEHQFGIILKEEVLYKELMIFIDRIISSFQLKHNPYDWIDVFKLQLGLAMYFDKQNLLDCIHNNIMQEISYWTPKNIKYGDILSVEEWRKKIYTGLEDRNKFMEAIEMNCQRPKVTKLNVAHIIGIDEYTVDEYTKKDVIDLSWRERLRSFFSK